MAIITVLCDAWLVGCVVSRHTHYITCIDRNIIKRASETIQSVFKICSFVFCFVLDGAVLPFFGCWFISNLCKPKKKTMSTTVQFPKRFEHIFSAFCCSKIILFGIQMEFLGISILFFRIVVLNVDVKNKNMPRWAF